ncbi:MAG: hypothetical protein O3C60_10730 [Planctomycetota bacterium]|nr:hypothetical protein [Planctomycetota bacterium]
MNCQETRRYWDLFYDSEGDAELHFQLNEHLDNCVECAEWFDKQSRLESLIEQRLGVAASVELAPQVNWSSVLTGAGVTPAAKSRSWLFFSSSILALAASLLLIVGMYGLPFGDESPSLSYLSAEVHQHVSAGSLRPEFESRSDIEVDQYLLNKVSFPVRCPPRKDSGFAVAGAGLCELSQQPAAYVVGTVDQRPVSIFVLSKDSLDAFPKQRAELQRMQLTTCREGDTEMVLSIVDRNLVLVAGNVDSAKLTRVLKSYGTYPHTL